MTKEEWLQKFQYIHIILTHCKKKKTELCMYWYSDREKIPNMLLNDIHEACNIYNA